MSYPTHATVSGSCSRLAFAFCAAKQTPPVPDWMINQVRTKSASSGYSPLNDPLPNWSNRPPKETILLDGCNYEHWLIVMEFPLIPNPSTNKLLMLIKEEAKKKIYSVSTTTYTGFGATIFKELSYKVKELPGVLWVVLDSYLDIPNKDYGGIMRGNQLGADLGHGMTGVVKQCRLKGETMFKDRTETKAKGPMQQSTPMNNQNSPSSGPQC
ncbi:hypothetical protein PIB30_006425 [Stylosanthes scabra]|uniref:MORF/ORRM1/DAG-like MORF domain-containing protein n=1 Tax=Stylosanthes scabra TaxID=79078 RepID=A0ABU6U699_9FABA|nr:hypothetical protein [Stylosanthes scabra]